MTFNEGDKVYVTTHARGSIRKATITRVTKTQAIIANERYEEKYNRETGRMIGSSAWDTTYIKHPTPSLDKLHHTKRIENAKRALANVALEGSDDAIRSAYAAWDRLAGEEK